MKKTIIENIPSWIYRNLLAYGNVYLPNHLVETFEEKSLINHVKKVTGIKCVIREALFEDTPEDYNTRTTFRQKAVIHKGYIMETESSSKTLKI